MDQALKKEILIELEFLLKNKKYLNEDIGDWASGKWQEFKDEASWLGKEAGLTAKNVTQGDFSRVKEVGRALSLGVNDLKELYEKDPRIFWQSIGDIISLVDPTGIADLINAGVYLYNGEKTMGIISLITGGLTAVGAIASIAGGAGLPIIVLGKTIKTIKFAKDGSKLFSICEKLATFFPKIIEKIKIVTNSMPGLKPVETEALGFFARLKNALTNKAGFQNFDNMFNYLFGGGKLESAIKTINSAEFSKQARAVSQGITQAAGVGLTTAMATEAGSEIREREEVEKQIRSGPVCSYSSCNTIYYDKNTKKYMDSETGKPDVYFQTAYNITLAAKKNSFSKKD